MAPKGIKPEYGIRFTLWERLEPPPGRDDMLLFCCLDLPYGIILFDRGVRRDAMLWKVYPSGEPQEIARQSYIKGIGLDLLLTHFSSVCKRHLDVDFKREA